ncbi:MAG: hypothetical protein FD142_3194 [bacterium]|nr:MAG: hypothetical protein FD142_3194 [bacterium]
MGVAGVSGSILRETSVLNHRAGPQGDLPQLAAGGLIQYQRWAGHIAWSTNTALIRSDAVEGLGRDAGVARGDRRKRRLRGSRRRIERVDRQYWSISGIHLCAG